MVELGAPWRITGMFLIILSYVWNSEEFGLKPSNQRMWYAVLSMVFIIAFTEGISSPIFRPILGILSLLYQAQVVTAFIMVVLGVGYMVSIMFVYDYPDVPSWFSR